MWDDNLKMDLKERVVGYGLDSCGSGQAPVARSCTPDNEAPGSIKVGNLFNN
jgi:hypothetical protein